MPFAPELNYRPPAEQNRRLVLQVLRRHRALSRRQISGLTGLRGSTLTYVVRDLMEQKLLRTAGKRSSTTAGPKQTLLQINPDFGYAVGFDLRRHCTLMVLCNAAGELIDTQEVATDMRLEEVPVALREALHARLHKLALTGPGELLGIGIGVPGIVDATQGIVVHSATLNVKNYPLRRIVETAFDSPALVMDHDANFAALAEARCGAARGLTDFVYFLINSAASRDSGALRSFGAALLLGGQVYHGTNFAAGELRCNLLPRLDASMQPEDWECLRHDDRPLTPFLVQLAQEMGRSMASIISLLDPQGVVVGADQWIGNQRFIELIEQSVTTLIGATQPQQAKIVASSLGREAVALGAALAATVASDSVIIRTNGNRL